MTIKEMHYDFKRKLNKIDSQQNKNLLIPEIDSFLNEAQELFVKMIAEPRLRNHLGFESSQRVIDDIRTVVVNNNCLNVVNDICPLPTDYWFFLKANVKISKGKCTNVTAKFKLREHDDDFEMSKLYGSSFEWRKVNGLFTEDGIKLYTDNTFTINELCLSYIRELSYIHNAEDFRTGSYKLPGSPTALTGVVNCELPRGTHREIVDIAVFIATGEIQASDYEIKFSKLNLNDLK